MRRSCLLFDWNNRPTEEFASLLRDAQIPGDEIRSINNALQLLFYQKNPDGSPKERWELEKVQVDCSPDRLKQHLAACGFLDEILPSGINYSYAAWPGALVIRAAARLFDHIDVWSSGVRWDKTIVFGGKRPLLSDKEGFVQCCQAMGMRFRNFGKRLWEEMKPETELDMMRWVWQCAQKSVRLDATSVVFVDAPMKPPLKEGGSPVRPTTEDTVKEWLKSNPEPGSILLSCGNPYAGAIDEAFWMLLGPYGFTVETFGHAAPDLPIENLMREVAGCVNRIFRVRMS